MARLARAASSDLQFRKLTDLLGNIQAVDGFVRANYRYRDEAEEIVRTPQFMVNDMTRLGYMEGDCDDVSTLYAAFAVVLGMPARLVAIRYNPENPNFEHVFTQAYDGENWLTLDGTVQPGTQIKSLEEMTEAV